MLKYAILILYMAAAFAGEGFDDRRYSLPTSIQPAWDMTFGVFLKHGGAAGSSFLADKEQNPRNGEYYFYFVTSRHVVESLCGFKRGPCAKLFLSASLGTDNEKNQNFSTDSNKRTFDKVEVVKIQGEPDLAMLKVVVDSTKYWTTTPVTIEDNCKLNTAGSAVFVIGYPGTYHRRNPKGTTSENKFQTIKRWSQGLLIGTELFAEGQNLMTTTADALPGNSGGPAVNSSGRVFGVLDSKIDLNQQSSNFVGDEVSNPKKPHSNLERCEALKAFLSTKQ